jgi:hypothetical protein
MDNTNRPDLRAYIGSTGSGKGVSVREHLKASKPDRLVVWDPLHEYGGFGRTVTTIAELANAMKAPKFALCFNPGPDVDAYAKKFDLVCRAVFAAGRCTFLVEELSQVTKASWAPQSWRNVTKRGRHQGLRVIGCTQRPADTDKDFFGGLTYCRVFQLRFRPDKVVMADLLDVPYSQVAELATVENESGTHQVTTINYLERDWRAGTSGKNTIVLKRPKRGAT